MKKLFKIFTKRKKEEAIQEELDNIFDLWAIILNFGGFVTLIFTYNMQAEYSSASVTGFLFMFTIVLSLFEMMVAAARPVALARLATYLHYLLTFLFVGTLTSTLVTALVWTETGCSRLQFLARCRELWQ